MVALAGYKILNNAAHEHSFHQSIPHQRYETKYICIPSTDSFSVFCYDISCCEMQLLL